MLLPSPAGNARSMPVSPKYKRGPAPTPACSRRTRQWSTSTSLTPRRPPLSRRRPRTYSMTAAKCQSATAHRPSERSRFAPRRRSPRRWLATRRLMARCTKSRSCVTASSSLPSAPPRHRRALHLARRHAAGHAAGGARRGHRGRHGRAPRARLRAAGGGA